MNSQILRQMGKVAGLGGLALGVLLIVFLSFLNRPAFLGTLNSDQTFALAFSLLVFTFGTSIVGLIAYLAAPTKRSSAVPYSVLLTISILLVIIIAAAVFGARLLDHVSVSPDNRPTSESPPSPPSPIGTPLTGLWDIEMVCPDTSAVTEPNADFKDGKYSRTFIGVGYTGKTELALGSQANGQITLSGHITFGTSDVYAVDATAKASGGIYTGTGRFGSAQGCRLTAKPRPAT
jgi:hypothetical protein